MKKYTKPEIFFEDFSLSTSIAACANEAQFSGEFNPCKGYEFAPGVILFVNAETGCNVYNNTDQNDEYCYHVPNTSLNLFGS